MSVTFEIKTETDKDIESFIAHVTVGVNMWAEAGQILVRLVDEKGGDILRQIEEKCPGLCRETLDLFLKIGRREIYPMLAIDHSCGVEYLAALPYDMQEKVYAEGVLVVDRYGEEEPQITPIGRLTSLECEQVFNGVYVRTAEEQEVWLRKRERENEKKRAEAAAKQLHRKSLKFTPIVRGDRSGFDADAAIITKSTMSLDELKQATPAQLLTAALEQAHIALLDARRHLDKVKKNSAKDAHITIALSHVGQLRYAASNGEL